MEGPQSRGCAPPNGAPSCSHQQGSRSSEKMGPVATSLATIGTTQVLLASVFLGSYALALGKFAGTHGRLIATATAVLSAAGFIALSNPWEAGVILLAF